MLASPRVPHHGAGQSGTPSNGGKNPPSLWERVWVTGGAFYLQVKGHIMQSSEEPVLRQPRNHLRAGARSPKGTKGTGALSGGRSRPGAGREGSVEETALVWAGVRQGQSGGVTVGRGVTGPPAMVVTRDSQCRVTHLYREQGTRSLSASLSSSEGGACDVSPCTRRPLSAQKLFSSVWGQSWSCFSSCPVRFSE